MEDRLMLNQEIKFKEMMAQLSLLPANRTLEETMTLLKPGTSALERGMLALSEKIDFLMSGENETNKVLCLHNFYTSSLVGGLRFHK